MLRRCLMALSGSLTACGLALVVCCVLVANNPAIADNSSGPAPQCKNCPMAPPCPSNQNCTANQNATCAGGAKLCDDCQCLLNNNSSACVCQ